MSTRTVAGICGVVAISITIWLESRGMKLEGQIFIWSVVALSGPVGMGLVTREFKQRWFWAGLMASGIVHAVVLWNLRTKLPAPNAFAPLLVGGIEGIGLAIMSGKIRDLMRQRSK